MRKKENITPVAITANMSIYMAYLLRYVQVYPVTAEQLKKKATDKHFPRLAGFLDGLPPERLFHNSFDVLDLLKDAHQG
jgi:hypothetical protein